MYLIVSMFHDHDQMQLSSWGFTASTKGNSIIRKIVSDFADIDQVSHEKYTPASSEPRGFKRRRSIGYTHGACFPVAGLLTVTRL